MYCVDRLASVDDETASVPAPTMLKNLRTGRGGRNRGTAESSTMAQQLQERLSQGSDADIGVQAGTKTKRVRGAIQKSKEQEVTKTLPHSSHKMTMITKTVQRQALTKQARILQLANLLKAQTENDSEDERLGFGFFGNNDNDKDLDDECGRSDGRLGFFGGGGGGGGKSGEDNGKVSHF